MKAVKDNGVDADGKNFDNNLDESAKQRPVLRIRVNIIRFRANQRAPYLKSAYQCIVNVLLKQILALAVFAGPAPHILAVPVLLAFIQYCSTDCPHHYTEREESYREDGVVDGGFLCSLMTASPVCVEDAKGEGQRYACDAKHSNLGPCLLVRSPRREITPGRQRFRGVEYCESS